MSYLTGDHKNHVKCESCVRCQTHQWGLSILQRQAQAAIARNLVYPHVDSTNWRARWIRDEVRTAAGGAVYLLTVLGAEGLRYRTVLPTPAAISPCRCCPSSASQEPTCTCTCCPSSNSQEPTCRAAFIRESVTRGSSNV